MMVSKRYRKISSVHFLLLIELYKKTRLLKSRRWMIFVIGNSTWHLKLREIKLGTWEKKKGNSVGLDALPWKRRWRFRSQQCMGEAAEWHPLNLFLFWPLKLPGSTNFLLLVTSGGGFRGRNQQCSWDTLHTPHHQQLPRNSRESRRRALWTIKLRHQWMASDHQHIPIHKYTFMRFC